jgi:pimeloyl-ACP methyl ester carboxylesterase
MLRREGVKVQSQGKKGYADGPFGQVHYRAIRPDGAAGEPLVLLHQTPCSSAMFAAAYPLLANAGHFVIGIDTPGFGQSDAPSRAPTIEDYASSVCAVLDHLGIAHAAVLGHHTGAVIAAQLAVDETSRVVALILNGVPLFTPDEAATYLDAIRAAPTLVPAPDGRHLLALWERRVQFTPGWSDLQAMHNGVVQMLICGDRGLEAYDAVFRYDMAAQLQRIRQPTLILTNTGEDLYLNSKRARELRPDFQFVELTGGTHDIVDEQPEAWCAAVIGFLKHDR